MKTRFVLAALLSLHPLCQTYAQSAPSYAVRQQTLKSLVRINASGCADQTRRVGTGFALASANQILTAHHVVGGCTSIRVSYEGVPPPGPNSRTAVVSKVLAAGDLALLTVSNAPNVPVLQLGSTPNTAHVFAGFGYQHGLPTAGEQEVKLSVGSNRLSDVLPERGESLRRIGSPIDTNRHIVRFGTALQPGMSGGPIIDPSGRVIAIVAGGLKAGASTASWGWPVSWVSELLASNESTTQNVRVAGVYYTQEEMDRVVAAINSTQQLRCGGLNFTFQGRKRFGEVSETADDKPRLRHILGLSRMSQMELNNLEFDLWVHGPSGATAVAPAGYQLSEAGPGCVANSTSGPFEFVVWGATANGPNQVQAQSQLFETTMMAPRVPTAYQWAVDPQLTTFQAYNVPGPQFRPNGLVFNRKGFTYSIPGPAGSYAHMFSTLVAHSGTMLGVGIVNARLDANMSMCYNSPGMLSQPVCSSAKRHADEWTHFVLATQLSTYPSI